MDLKTILSYAFRNWLQPIMFSFITFPIFILSIFIEIGIFQILGITLFFIGMIWLLVSSIYLFFKGQWRKGFYSLLFILAIIISFSLLA